jgi:hypothetical protein
MRSVTKVMIYELRIYTVYPEKLPDLMHLWEHEGKPLIDKHMRCLGIWTTDSGLLNRVVHLYLWESHEQRDRARKAFYSQPEAKAYVNKVKPLYQAQESVIMSPAVFAPCQLK